MKERLISSGADYERQEEKYTNEIERLQEKLNKVSLSFLNTICHFLYTTIFFITLRE